MSIDEDIAFLETVPALRSLGHDALRILAIGGESRPLGAGDILFRAGDKADCGYVVQEGTLRLLGESEKRGDDDPHLVGPGTLIGEMALLIDTVRPVTAIAMAPSVVMRIPRQLFLKMLEGVPAAAARLRDEMAARAIETVESFGRVRDLLGRDETA